MEFYKIKHKPTGLYYKPAKGSYKKVSLSQFGKVYTRKSDADRVLEMIRTKKVNIYVTESLKIKYNLDTQKACYNFVLTYNSKDFELEEYKL